MPGKRNFAAERRRHAASCAQRQQDLYQMLRTQLPELERALVGYPAVLSYLRQLHIRRLNGGPLTRRIVQGWRRYGFPIVNGRYHPSVKTLPLTTTFAVTSWLLTRLDTADLYSVDMTRALATTGIFHTDQGVSAARQQNVAGKAA